MKRFLLIALIWLGYARAPAQDIPPNPVSDPVSFDANLPFNTALEILNGYSERHEKRIIIDPAKRTQAIGVSVEAMHWKRALEYILRSNVLNYEVHERYYEIVDATHGKAPQAPKTSADVDTREVLINAVFFEVDYETLYELGINWGTFKNGKVQVEAFGGNEIARDLFRVTTQNTIRGSIRVETLLRAFESRGQGEIIARPQIRVVDGEEGKVKVGKNFYLTLQDFAGNTRFSEYEAGVILTVTPTLFGGPDTQFIQLDIMAERSDVQPDIIGVTKNITEGKTRALLCNGEETVIAGLMSYETKSLRKGVPVLKDLPWWFFGARYFFGYNKNSVKKKEMIVLVQAWILPDLRERPEKTRNEDRFGTRLPNFRNAAPVVSKFTDAQILGLLRKKYPDLQKSDDELVELIEKKYKQNLNMAAKPELRTTERK